MRVVTSSLGAEAGCLSAADTPTRTAEGPEPRPRLACHCGGDEPGRAPQRLHVLLKAERAQRPQQVIAVDGFSLFSLALVARPDSQRGEAASAAGRGAAAHAQGAHSLVMKEMNSDTHSCIVSLLSFAILALAGSARFMMRLMLAMGRYLSCSRPASIPSSSASSPAAPAIEQLRRRKNAH